jgi:hypothetical protein
LRGSLHIQIVKTDAEIRANRDPNIIPIANEEEADKFAARLRAQADNVRKYGSNGQVARPWEFKGTLVLPKCEKCGLVPDNCYCVLKAFQKAVAELEAPIEE